MLSKIITPVRLLIQQPALPFMVMQIGRWIAIVQVKIVLKLRESKVINCRKGYSRYSKCNCWLIEKRKDRSKMEIITIQFNNSMLYDRLHILSAEYSVSVDSLISLAAKRLLDDVELVRDLRNGKVKLE